MLCTDSVMKCKDNDILLFIPLLGFSIRPTQYIYIRNEKIKANRETISTVSRLMVLYGQVPGECGAPSLSLEAKSFHHCLSGTFLCPVKRDGYFFF